MIIASAEDAHPTRRRASSNGTGFWLTTYIGANRYTRGDDTPPEPGTIYPMAFLVEQDPKAVVGAHYHQADQFQVMVDGSGRLGRHDVASGDVHFAGARSAYGPLAAGTAGLTYFTLRNGWDPGARYMEFPDNRAALRALPRRHREQVGLIEGSRRFSLTTGERIEGPAPSLSAGQFWLVLSGNLQCDDRTLPQRSCVFLHPHDPPFTAHATTDASVLLLQFPKQ
jgi:hypothetical protein